jgi:hypothetical protein
MVTNFNKKDIVSFGNYLLSINKKSNEVKSSDIENWLEIKKNKGSIPVLAKFQVLSVERKDEYKQTYIEMQPVMSGSEENKSFSKYTPAGQISIVVSDDTDASDYFEEGKEYFVKFTKA